MVKHESIRNQFMFVFRSLRARNYRLFFIGQSTSLIGTWVARVAMSWLAYRLTGSAFMLGVIGFAGQIPTSILVPFAGVLADRWNRHRILLISQAALMIQTFVVALLTLTHQVEVWHLVAASIWQGVANAFDIPARQSLLPEMIEKKQELNNAIALNSSMFNAARLVGPAIAGVLIGLFGEGICFLIDGISYGAVIYCLLQLKLKTQEKIEKKTHILEELKEGFSYAFGFLPIRAVLMLVAWTSLMGMSYIVLMPVFAKDILNGGPHELGFLTAASGLGALSGALYLASRKNVIGFERKALAGSLLGSFGLCLFAFSTNLWVSMIFVIITAFGMMVQLAASNTMMQTLVDDDKRGRVMSLYTLAFLGVAPFGSLLAGSIADFLGTPQMIFLGGVSCLTAAVFFSLYLNPIRDLIHPVYVRKGILPEIAKGIQSASNLSSPND